jgi:hypothetical protein
VTLDFTGRTRRFEFLHALGLTGLLGFLVARWVPLDKLPFWRCAIREHTGWPCPGCGLTRVAQRLARGDVGGALDANPLGTLVALGFAACTLYAALQLLFRLPVPRLSLTEREGRLTRALLLAAVVANYAVVVVRVRFLGWP